MQKSVVRLERIEISDLKNVKHGVLDLQNSRKGYQASVLGLYGQNGSGKTALIDAVSVLKYALTGRPLPDYYGDFVNIDAEYATLKFSFQVWNEEIKTDYAVEYQFCVKKVTDDSKKNTDYAADDNPYRIMIFDEVLSYSFQNETEKQRMQPIIDTRTEDVFLPSTKLAMLVGKEKTMLTDLLVSKKIASATSRSFIFSRELRSAVRQNCAVESHVKLMDSLAEYGISELFIIDTHKTGLLTLDALSLNFKYEENGKEADEMNKKISSMK